jgi:zinc transport system ATP-binding protein
MDSTITFNHVRFCYGEVCALKDACFAIDRNTLTALVGPNGGGKSTLIKLLSGLLRPEEGEIRRNGGLFVSYVPQNAGFDTSFALTVREMVLMGTLDRRIRPFSRYDAAQRDKAAQATLRVGLSGFENRSIAQLSGGQLKRAIIARSLASDADVLALDEPDAGLDIDAVRELYALLGDLKAEKTIVIASHHLDAVLPVADAALYVNGGVTVFADPPSLRDTLRGGLLT